MLQHSLFISQLIDQRKEREGGREKERGRENAKTTTNKWKEIIFTWNTKELSFSFDKTHSIFREGIKK
jgi:hypothetical protein